MPYVKVLTWNLCALTFPLRSWDKALTGLAGGRVDTDPVADVPVDADEATVRARVERQAEYIRHSGADVVLLQEVLSETTVSWLQCALGKDYEFRFARDAAPRGIGLYGLTTSALAAAQTGLGAPLAPAAAPPFWRLLHRTLQAGWSRRLEDTVVGKFLTGTVAGQLVTMCRRGGAVDTARLGEATFETFADMCGGASGGEGPFSLEAYVFAKRPRGATFLRVPLHGGSTLLAVNVHLPHGRNNDQALESLAESVEDAARGCPVVLGGDFNPDPARPWGDQFRALGATLRSTNVPCGREVVTWDLAQPLAREDAASTPRSMQLDFLFVDRDRPVVEPAAALAPEWFQEDGPRLSDHYGLVSTVRIP